MQGPSGTARDIRPCVNFMGNNAETWAQWLLIAGRVIKFTQSFRRCLLRASAIKDNAD